MVSKNLKVSKGYTLWKKAIKIIEGGNAYSKTQRGLFLVLAIYYSKAKGCEIWDTENKNILILYNEREEILVM